MLIPQVVEGALLRCSFGTAPTPLVVTTNLTVTIGGRRAATIMDQVGLVNIPNFVGCLSPQNPMFVAGVIVAAVTGGQAAAPCTPTISAPWVQPSLIQTINKLPVLLQTAMCFCNLAGIITITHAGQVQTQVKSI